MSIDLLRRRYSEPEFPGEDERPSGVPPPWRLGSSLSEMIYLVIGIIVFAAIALAFWVEATRF